MFHYIKSKEYLDKIFERQDNYIKDNDSDLSINISRVYLDNIKQLNEDDKKLSRTKSLGFFMTNLKSDSKPPGLNYNTTKHSTSNNLNKESNILFEDTLKNKFSNSFYRDIVKRKEMLLQKSKSLSSFDFSNYSQIFNNKVNSTNIPLTTMNKYNWNSLSKSQFNFRKDDNKFNKKKLILGEEFPPPIAEQKKLYTTCKNSSLGYYNETSENFFFNRTKDHLFKKESQQKYIKYSTHNKFIKDMGNRENTRDEWLKKFVPTKEAVYIPPKVRAKKVEWGTKKHAKKINLENLLEN